MKNILLLSFLFSLINLTAQSRFNFGVELEAGISGKNVSQGDFYESNTTLFAYYSENGQSYRPSFSAGVWASYRISRSFKLQTGFAFRQQNTAWYNLYDDRSPASPAANDSRNDFSLSIQRLEMPTSLNFYPLAKHRKIQPFVALGIRPGLFLDGEYMADRDAGLHTEVYDLQKETLVSFLAVPAFAKIGVKVDQWQLALSFSSESAFHSHHHNIIYCGFPPVSGNDISGYFPSPSINAPAWKAWSLSFSYQLF